MHEFALKYLSMILKPTNDGETNVTTKKKEKKSYIFHGLSRVSVQTMEASHQGKYRWPGCTVVAFRFLVKHISQATILAERERKKSEKIQKRY